MVSPELSMGGSDGKAEHNAAVHVAIIQVLACLTVGCLITTRSSPRFVNLSASVLFLRMHPHQNYVS